MDCMAHNHAIPIRVSVFDDLIYDGLREKVCIDRHQRISEFILVDSPYFLRSEDWRNVDQRSLEASLGKTG